MTRTEKFKDLHIKLKLERIIAECTYLKAESEQLLKHTEQFNKYVRHQTRQDLPIKYRSKNE